MTTDMNLVTGPREEFANGAQSKRDMEPLNNKKVKIDFHGVEDKK